MDDPFQQQALGRANATCAAIFAIFNRFAGDQQLIALLERHAEHARADLLNTQTPDVAIEEFEGAISAMLRHLAKTP